MIITPLDKAGARARVSRKRHWSEANLSELQRSLLKVGLQGWLRSRPLDLEAKLPFPGHFKIRTEMKEFKDRTERARRRAAAGRALKRLIQRGLLECCARGKWRLTASGVALAQRLYPQIKPDSKWELAHRVKLSKAYQDAHPSRGRRHSKRPGSELKPPAKPGVQIELDCAGLD